MAIKPPVRNKPPTAPSGKPPAPLAKQQVMTPVKKFSVAAWEGNSEGEKIIVYADSGMGKTTLASMAPKPVFIALDDGSRKICNPLTGERLQRIPGVETYDDIRAVVRQFHLFDGFETLVVDTGTIMQDLALTWMLANIKAGEHGKQYDATCVESYGWGKGYRHLYDTMKLILADFDALVHHGKNVIILCQMAQDVIANAGGADFMCDVPKLQGQHGKVTPAVWSAYNEWADHVLKIGYSNIASQDGKAASNNERVIFVHGQVHFKAKSRTIPYQYPVVSFSHPGDCSIWEFLFNEAWKNLEDQK